MNLAGSDVERLTGRSAMPHFHAAFSLGTVVAAGVGSLVAGLGWGLRVHFGLMAAVALLVVALGVVNLTPEGANTAGRRARRTQPTPSPASSNPTQPSPSPEKSAQPQGWRAALAAWREGRTLLIGVVMLAMSLAEGAASDWLASGIVEDFPVGESVGVLGLGLFLTAMTLTRIVGTRAIERFGRVVVLRVSGVAAAVGLLGFGLSPWLVGALASVVVWGCGSALAFPLGVSAAGDDPARAAQRTSVVTTVAYGAFMAGPPLLGLLADHVGFRHSLLAILVPVALAFAIARVVEPPAGRSG
jgi:MFS family permease